MRYELIFNDVRSVPRNELSRVKTAAILTFDISFNEQPRVPEFKNRHSELTLRIISGKANER